MRVGGGRGRSAVIKVSAMVSDGRRSVEMKVSGGNGRSVVVNEDQW